MKKRNVLVGVRRSLKIASLVSLILMLSFLAGCSAVGDDSTDGILSGLLGVDSSRSQSVTILILLTVLSLVPSLLVMLTGFTRIIIVLSLIRNAIGLQQMPPNQVLVGLALFLTFFVMAPVVGEINQDAYQPYLRQEITADEAVTRGLVPLRTFMMEQTRTEDMNFFLTVSGNEALEAEEYDDIPTSALIPAFITSEIKRGFQIGFFIYIPFIVIDMIVASTLMSMGMMMLPPVTISMPFKLLLFVLVDGWGLTIQTLLTSFG